MNILEKTAAYMILVSLFCCNLVYSVSASNTSNASYQKNSLIYHKYENAIKKTNDLNNQEYEINIKFPDKSLTGNSQFEKIGNSFNYITKLYIQGKTLRMWSNGENIYMDTPLGIVKSDISSNDIDFSKQYNQFNNNIKNNIVMENIGDETKFILSSNSKDIASFANYLQSQFKDENSILGINKILNTNSRGVYEVYVNKEGYAYKFITHFILDDKTEITTNIKLINIGNKFQIELPKETTSISKDIIKDNDAGIDFSEEGITNSFGEIIEFINNLGW